MNIGLYNKGRYKFKCPACETACNGHVKTENSRRVIMVTKDFEQTADLAVSGRQDTVGSMDSIACPACGENGCIGTSPTTALARARANTLTCRHCGYTGEAEYEVRIRWHGPEVAELSHEEEIERLRGLVHAPSASWR